MAVDPTGADLKRLLAEDPGGPVVMLNLLRSPTAAGRHTAPTPGSWLRRSSPATGPRSSTPVRLDRAGRRAGQAWDAALLVRYPSREAFSRMVADPEYQQVTGLRTQALTEAVLQATTPWPTR